VASGPRVLFRLAGSDAEPNKLDCCTSDSLIKTLGENMKTALTLGFTIIFLAAECYRLVATRVGQGDQ